MLELTYGILREGTILPIHRPGVKAIVFEFLLEFRDCCTTALATEEGLIPC